MFIIENEVKYFGEYGKFSVATHKNFTDETEELDNNKLCCP